jgi:DNA-directed RNA polymerase subunit RPC12/RpoP
MKCPGQDMQFWEEDAIYEVRCPECSKMVEFYKDDTTRKCHHCNHRFVNPKMDFGCATYCQFAEQCLGTLPEEFVLQQDNLLKDKVAVEMKRYFANDFKRIRITTKIAQHAENIGKTNENVNLALILCSAYLFIIGHKSALKKTEHPSLSDIETENPVVAAEILEKVGAGADLIEAVQKIVGNVDISDKAIKNVHTIVYDAYKITMLEQKLKENDLSQEELQAEIAAIDSAQGRKEVEKALAM